jgi:hypothetical protein
MTSPALILPALLDATSRTADLREAATGARERIAGRLSWTACARRWLENIERLAILPPQASLSADAVVGL